MKPIMFFYIFGWLSIVSPSLMYATTIDSLPNRHRHGHNIEMNYFDSNEDGTFKLVHDDQMYTYVPPFYELQSTEIELSRNAIYFETNSSQIANGDKLVLDAIIEIVEQDNNIRVILNGYTDGVGNDTHNKALSQKRADNVKKYFMEQGIDDSRLKAGSWGEDNPVAYDNSDKGRELNRRVEVILIGDFSSASAN